ncbi:MAG: NADH-quinone oxidoreductase subunit J [Candidatus Gastranaerophilales bacterium]|nr:NADH-quinone oxidoreductase subunit J [Candidatus Gastranaerophilales bacterium]
MFYLISAVIIITSIAVIFTKKIINSVFFALICFFGFGFLFFALNAPFNAAVQMSIYGCALSILFTIAIMITNYTNEQIQKIKFSMRLFLCFSGVLMIAFSIILALRETLISEPMLMMYFKSSDILITGDNIKQLSSELLTRNIYSFELLGIYLLIVLIGIAVLLKFKGETK